ncbi:DUF2793 domain-containing protein [Pseudoponticoccus marisrubri]|uniref:Uncharacterized protein n=1 Tax=Pseudoponticoccus marisrubri TaxID=1685382 RepID=A0A0W7WEH3_9RHOB|nr:DUF2793 domain-containing protein [Pseudoponticoccus marisrubri]KUF08957.1 hypothetical protein AVJ23_19905 [Pseudoponticoccus marisrubri]
MSETTARLELPLMSASQAQKHVTHNEALALLDGMVQLVLSEVEASVPPALPGEGTVYALGAAPAGDWAGQAHMLAQWQGGQWLFFAPQPGWRAWNLAGQTLLIYHDGAWRSLLDNLEGLGIGTGSDPINRLAVSAPATLLTHEGAGHQLKVNKASAGDTASLLYQSGWSGRAEMGLTGDDDFHVKVSVDGTAWTDALVVDAATGTLSGAAIQDSPMDAGANRVMTVGAFGLGAADAVLPDGNDLNNIPFATSIGHYFGNSSTANAPFTWAAIINVSRAPSRSAQIALDTLSQDEPRAAIRSVRDDGNSPWRELYHCGNIVGQVWQTGGVPEGAVIERGSNADGTYVRFADGTQICTHAINLGDPTSAGSGTFSDPYLTPVTGQTITFPAAFVAAPTLSVAHSVAGGGSGALSRAFTSSFHSVDATGVSGYRAVRMTGSNDSSDVTLHYTAIGRWV